MIIVRQIHFHISLLRQIQAGPESAEKETPIAETQQTSPAWAMAQLA
jgi:hypothetical protein